MSKTPSDQLQGPLAKSFLFGTFLIFTLGLSAQPGIDWEENYGGSVDDEAYSVQQTDDGGYIVAGYTNSDNGDVSGNNGGSDQWVVKLDSSGALQWEENYGGTKADVAYSVHQTEDGGYIVAGYAESDDGDVSGNKGYEDYWVIKLDSTGNLEWEGNFGGSYDDRARSVQQTEDGGYIVAGMTESDDGDVSGNTALDDDYWVVKLDSSGTLQWEGNYGGNEEDRAKSIQQTDDGGYIVAGYSTSDSGDVSGNKGSEDHWIVKLDGSGSIQWEKNYGGSWKEKANSVQQTDDGGYIVAGYSDSNDGDVSVDHGEGDYWLLKLDNSGNLQWERSYGGSDWDIANSVQQTDDGGYIVGGYSDSEDGHVSGTALGSDEYWLVKLDSSGNLQWEGTFGGDDNEYAESVLETENGDYILAGRSLSSSGDVSGNNGIDDFWIVKVEGPSGTGISREALNREPSLYPNPTRQKVTIELPGVEDGLRATVRDVTGRAILEERIEDPSRFQLELGEEAGIYFVELEYPDGEGTVRKVIKE